MTTIDVLISQTKGLNRADLELWIHNDWVKPDAAGNVLNFGEIDVARVILIHELREDLEVNDAALPIVLSLIDQLYDLRRNMLQLAAVMEKTLPDDLRSKVLEGLAGRNLTDKG